MDTRVFKSSTFLLFIGVLSGCDSTNEPATSVPAEPVTRLSVPLELTVEQRTTTVVPGAEDRLSLTIDDITRNQVMVSIGTDTGETPLPTRSMSPGEHMSFEYAGERYVLRLEELDNTLVGEDTARFSIAALGENRLSEQAQIERLIEAVAELDGVTFIRNGSEHTTAEAADHLRTKWNAARGKITTAQQFIDEIASQSSVTGEPYLMRLADGTTVEASDFLTRQLAAISASSAKN